MIKTIVLNHTSEFCLFEKKGMEEESSGGGDGEGRTGR